MSYNVAVVGATGNVGREMLAILAERLFPVNEVYALASRRSVGLEVSFGDKTLKCRDLETFDFSKVQFCLMSAGGAVSKEWSPRIAAKGCVVIDNSSTWRYDRDVPLIVPEVNADAVAGYSRRNIIANPNCSTAQLVVALSRCTTAPPSSAWWSPPISPSPAPARMPWTSCGPGPRTSMSPATRTATPRSSRRRSPSTSFLTSTFHGGREHEGGVEDGGRDQEDFLDPKIKVTATCVRVPVFVGHSEAVNVEFEKPITAEEAREILREAPGCLVVDKLEPGGYVTPMEAAGEDATYMSRIREDGTVENGLNLWVVC